MKNILFVIPTLRMGGAEKSLVTLLKALDPEKVNIDLLVFEPEGVLRSEVPEYVHVIDPGDVTRGLTLEFRTYFKNLLKALKFRAAFARWFISVYSALKPKLHLKPIFSWGVISKYVPAHEKKYDVAISYLEDFSNNYVIEKTNADRKIGWIHIDLNGKNAFPEEHAIYKRFDGVATISDVCKEAALKVYPELEGRIEIIENIVRAEDVLKKAEESFDDAWDEQRIHLVSVGRVEHQKGFDLGAKACAELKNRGYQICWHVYGLLSYMTDEVKQIIKELDIGEEFLLEGLRANPYPYMRQADIIIQPSRFEGKSIVLDEAKILGKPIVVTKYPSVSDQIANGRTGLIVEMTPVAIADGIEKLITDRKMRTAFSVNCRNEVNNSEKAVGKFYKLIGI